MTAFYAFKELLVFILAGSSLWCSALSGCGESGLLSPCGVGGLLRALVLLLAELGSRHWASVVAVHGA